MTLLSVAGRRGADLLITGAGFCVAVFLTYLCIGFGLFTLLRELRAFEWMATAIRWITILALALLAVFSFRDAWRYKRSGKGADVTLQLPDGLKRRIHAVMRNRLKTRSLLLGSVATGFVVTLLESVCTGQLYVPTLVFMTKTAEQSGSAVLLLLLYNAAFVVPLVLVFAAAHRGMTNERLVAWSRRNVVPSKVSLGVFFSLLAGVMWLSG